MTRINIYGPIGFKDWDGNGVLTSEIIEALAAAEGDLDVHVNSPGGIATDGVAIFNALKAYEGGTVTITVDGVASSAASLLTMAGKKIVMAEGALMMIHDPSGISWGPAEEHRRVADILEKMADVYAGVYARRSGQKNKKVRDMMIAETWFTPTEAVDLGFADEAAETKSAEPTAFDWTLFRRAPDSLRAKATAAPAAPPVRKDLMMTDKTKAPANPGAQDDPAVVEPAATQPTAQANQAMLTAERNRVKEIRLMCRNAKITDDAFVDGLIDAGATLLDAKSKVLDKMIEAEPKPILPTATAHVTGDGIDRLKTGAGKALMAKAGLKDGERNEFSSMTLREIARATLQARGLNAPHRDAMTMIGHAFVPTMIGGLHSTSDFGEILEAVANKSALKGWEEAAETFTLWTSVGTASDFKIQKRVGVNLFPNLTEIPEGAEYGYGTIGDRGESLAIATYGKMIAFTRQAIINDDMSLLTGIPRGMGRAAKRTIGNLVYAILTGNPTMSNSVALFHATHGNLAGAAAAPSTASLDAGRTAMGIQKDPDAIASALNISPAFFLVPKALEGKAKVVMSSETEIAASQNNSKVPNSVAGMAQVIAEGRLDAASATAWYLAANPGMHDTIEVTYLDGVQEPVLEQQDGWKIDGTEFKVRIDAGVKALDFRGLYKNAGT